MLHAKELPSRHLLQELDGGTQGSNVFSGIISKALSNCEELLTVNYSPIALDNYSNMENVDLITDQQIYAKRWKMGIVVLIQPHKTGPVCHSR